MAKRGRPIKEDAKRGVLNFRLDAEAEANLHELCEITGKNKSEVLRDCVAFILDIYRKKGEW